MQNISAAFLERQKCKETTTMLRLASALQNVGYITYKYLTNEKNKRHGAKYVPFNGVHFY